MNAQELDLETRYKVEGYEGIAFYTIGYNTTRDEDYEWTGIENVDTDFARMIMVGDDEVHVIPVDDITPIEEDAYCHECGQIGCKVYD